MPLARVYANVMLCLSGIQFFLGCEVIVGLAADISNEWWCQSRVQKRGHPRLSAVKVRHLAPLDLLHIYVKHDVELTAEI